MAVNRRILILVVFAALTAGCIEPYSPAVRNGGEYLVIDAFLDATTGRITVALSYSMPLDSIKPSETESFAVVNLEDDLGNIYPVPLSGNGFYSGTINVSMDRSYRIVIRIAQSEYISDFVSVKQTPEIDSVTYRLNNYNELDIAVTSHDPEGKSRYYLWRFEETYEYRSKHRSAYVIRPNGEILLRPVEEDIHTCWRTVPSTRIIVATTNLLSEDIVRNFTIQTIRKGDLRISRRYSINVIQQTLDENGYNFWLNLQKSTESLGGLFDPMPSQVSGNVRNRNDPDEVVLGFFDVSTTVSERIFIDAKSLPGDFTYYQHDYCEIDSIMLADLPKVTNPNALIQAIFPPGAIRPTGYTSASPRCIDCRLFGGGVTQKPDFWEE